MRLVLTFSAVSPLPVLTLNYQYPLSAAIYKIIQRADASFSAFLHNKGYGENKSFKLFTFSDLSTPFKIHGGRMQMLSNTAQLTVCFHIHQAAENFIKGLFMHQQLDIADKKTKAAFVVQQVEAVDTGISNDEFKNGKKQITVQPIAAMVTGRKNAKGYYDYLSPSDAGFTECLLHNWLEKYKAVNDISEDELQQLKQQTSIQVLLYPQPPKQRLITIKQGTPEETKIRGYTKFKLQLSAPVAMLQLALNAGLGLYNSMGMGCISIV